MMLFEPNPVVKSRIRERFSDMPAHLRPLWGAVLEGCSYAMVMQNDGAFTVPKSRPAVVVLGDDLHTSKRPAAFHLKSLRRYLSRCSEVAIVSSGALPDAYATLALQAIHRRRDVAIIETLPAHAPEWFTLAQESAPLASVLLCQPYQNGGPH